MAESEQNMIGQLAHVFRAIPPTKKIAFGVIICVVLGGFVALMLWTNRPDYQVLFSNMDTSDASRIMERLKEKRIPFQLKDGGRAILVPDENVYELRLELASDGLPQGRSVGFEIFNDMPFGTTEFVQRLKYQQALQGELARTITEFDAVAQARVHIVTSNESLFIEPENRSTASVVLRLHQGRALDRRQLQGIINLVAAAVEGLKPESISVVDVEGGLLSKGHQDDDAAGASGTQFDYKRKIEQNLENRIRTMLEPVVGSNRVVARVTAEADFRQVSISEEQFDPDSSVIRSEQRQKETAINGKGLPSGSPDLKYEIYETQGGGGTRSSKSFEKENSVINYEINRINKQVISSVGDIKRLSAAVIIDGPYVGEKDAEGNVVQKFVPRSRREMKNFEDIVKKAIGFDETRGDQVIVSNSPFAMQEDETVFSEGKPGWLGYLKKGTKPIFNIALILMFFFLAIKPLRKWLRQATQYAAPQALPAGGEMPQLESATGAGSGEVIRKQEMLDLGKTEPEKIAQVIRGWIREGQ
jgi:flagellar M-ring protein FliF